MKINKSTLRCNLIFVALSFFLFSSITFAQVIQSADTLKATQADTLKAAHAATQQAVPADTPKADGEKDKKDKKGKKNEIIFYTGVNFTQLGTSTGYESETQPGYQLGGYYKQGRMLYWQAGARFASSKFGYKQPDSTEFTGISVSDADFPLTLGVNFTSFMNRVLSVRLFVSAVPSFTLKVADNPYGITKDKLNSFVLYGQGGLGVNVAFMILELGYNYGFNELIVGNTDSKPGQLFINLGFRF
ncbi:MAG: hypothetical protein WCI92_07780 [Bacteroidota bacterium]